LIFDIKETKIILHFLSNKIKFIFSGNDKDYLSKFLSTLHTSFRIYINEKGKKKVMHAEVNYANRRIIHRGVISRDGETIGYDAVMPC